MSHADLRIVAGTGPEPVTPVDRLPVSTVAVAELAGNLSPRASGADPVHVRALAEVEAELPPILVHRPTMAVLDGLHRLAVARLRGRADIVARLVDGDEAEAFVLAVRTNAADGRPLDLADRKHAAARIMATHTLWSDRRIATVTGLSARTVADLRRRHGGTTDARVGRDGRVRPLDGAAGRRRAAEMILADPGLSLRQVARAVGISPETVRDVRAKLLAGRPGPNAPDHAVNRPAPGLDRRPPSANRSRPVSPGSRLGAVRTLRADPSIRFTDSGRMLLRLLDLHAASSAHWSELVDSLPPHSVEAVAEAARACAVMWTDLSRRLDPRVCTTA